MPDIPHSKTIHYAWIGPPTRDNIYAIAGHDIAGPIETARKLQEQAAQGEEVNPIKFWCLKEHEEYYQTVFKNERVDIEVCAVEDLLDATSHKERAAGMTEAGAEHAEAAAFMQKLLDDKVKNADKDDSTSRVLFKDGFSLFLLLCQGGYFFDTSIFPEHEKNISLSGEDHFFTGANQEVINHKTENDFYMMYSPDRNNSTLKEVFDSWKSDPKFANINAFKSSDKIPFVSMDEQRNKMGINKIGFKSYSANKSWYHLAGKIVEIQFKKINFKKTGIGLFYWLERNRLDKEQTPLENYLSYGDINQQMHYPSSTRFLDLGDTSLGGIKYQNDEDKKEKMEKLIAKCETNKGYLLVSNDSLPNSDHAHSELYYFDKKTNTIVLVLEKVPRRFSEVIEYLRNMVIMNNEIYIMKSNKLESMTNILSMPILKFSERDAVNYVPSQLVNTANCTLLHHAVLTNQIEQVECLIKAGARLDLKATYQLLPEGRELELTPLELAQFLKQGEMANVLIKGFDSAGLDQYLQQEDLEVAELLKNENRAKTEVRFFRKGRETSSTPELLEKINYKIKEYETKKEEQKGSKFSSLFGANDAEIKLWNDVISVLRTTKMLLASKEVNPSLQSLLDSKCQDKAVRNVTKEFVDSALKIKGLSLGSLASQVGKTSKT